MNAEQLKGLMRRYAESQGFQLNPDEKIVDFVIHGLLRNEGKLGYRYCPCRAITGDREQDRKCICPCAYHKDELKQMGRCLCRLFVVES
jgi:ferredoxin-thioredoxin reductase catalytic subunit